MALIERGVEYLIEKGYTNMLLWVLKQNTANRFYQKLQPTVVATSQFELAGEKHDELGYGWVLSELHDRIHKIKSSASSNNERRR